MFEKLEMSAMNLNSSQPHLVGWVPEAHSRGTLSLLVSCLSTTFLCTWVVSHPRIDPRLTTRLLHSFALCAKTFVAPEFIAVEAVQEWTQARRIVKQCYCKTNGQFKLIHAFYVGMFGIRYRCPSSVTTMLSQRSRTPTKILWPTQYVWLLEHGYTSWDEQHLRIWGLEEHVIHDKSNADSAAKLIALLGVGKFCVDAILRVCHHLPLTPLESMTLGYIPLFALTYLFWWLKPKDIEMPTIVDLPAMSAEEQEIFDQLALTDDFDDEGKDHQRSLWGIWRLTPRDFELKLFREERPKVPKKYGQGAVLASWDPDLYQSPTLWVITCLFAVAFGALHLVCWDTTFPTLVEKWVWRSSALLSMITMLVFMQFKQVILQWSRPTTIVSVISATVYLSCRVMAVVEVFAFLRACDPSIYQT